MKKARSRLRARRAWAGESALFRGGLLLGGLFRVPRCLAVGLALGLVGLQLLLVGLDGVLVAGGAVGLHLVLVRLDLLLVGLDRVLRRLGQRGAGERDEGGKGQGMKLHLDASYKSWYCSLL